MNKKRTNIFIVLIVLLLSILVVFIITKKSKKLTVEHVILISIDTLRADHLGCYNRSMDISPEIDKFSGDCLLFENVIVQVPLTLPSHSTMLSGTLPIYHRVRDNGDYHLDSSIITLAELFKERGFSTGGIASSLVLAKTTGIEQGFDTYIDEYEIFRKNGFVIGRRAEEATQLACDWLESHKAEKTFLFVHYFDPHIPYDPPGEFASRFADNPYAGEVCYTDKHIGLFIQKIKELGLYENSLIVLTADHGEMLGEHGESEHGFFIYESAIKVPLLIKLPGRKVSRRFSQNVGLVDIAPTICSITGITMPEQFQGYNLTNFKKSKTPSSDERYIYCESLYPTRYGCNSLLGVINGPWKFIQTNRPELYDVKADPKEEHDLINIENKRAYLMKEHLRDIIEKKTRNIERENKEKSVVDMRDLRSLGYVSTGKVDESVSFSPKGFDPKDLIGLFEEQKIVEILVMNNKLEEAKTVTSKMVSAHPDNLQFLSNLGDICATLEQYEEAEKLYNQLLSKMKLATDISEEKHLRNIIEANSKLVGISYKQKDIDKSIKYLKDILIIDPENIGALNRTGELMLEKGQQREAIEYWERSLALYTEQVSLRNKLSYVYLKLGDFQKARDHLKGALEIEPQKAETYYNLANAYYVEKKYNEALQNYEKAYEINPQLIQAKEHIEVCRKQIKTVNHIKALEKQLEEKPRDPMLHANLGTLYFNLGDLDKVVAHWEMSLEEKPEQIDLLNNLAWIMSDRNSELVFNPEKAVVYALKACELSEFNRPDVLDTLMTAYAAKGDFKAAVQIGEKALSLKGITENPELMEKIEKNLVEYRKKY